MNTIYLMEPLTLEEARDRIDELGFLSAPVAIKVDDLIKNDKDTIIGKISMSLIGYDLLDDMDFKVIGPAVDDDTMVVLDVKAKVGDSLGSSSERVLVKKRNGKTDGELFLGILLYDTEENDVELYAENDLYELGSFPLQSFEVVRYLDRTENLIQVFNKYFRFNVMVSAQKTVTPEFDGSFSHSGPHSMLCYDRTDCNLELLSPTSDAFIVFDSVKDEEALLMKLVHLLGPIVRDEGHAVELLNDKTLFKGLIS